MSKKVNKINTDDKLAFICEKAYVALIEQGVHRFSLNKFIDSLHMSKGQFYYYFKTKEDLICKTIDTKCYEAFEEAFELTKFKTTFIDKLTAFFALFVEESKPSMVELDRVLKNTFHLYFNAKSGAIKQLNIEFYERIFSYIDIIFEEMIEKGAIKEEARLLSHSFIATVDGMYVHSLMNDDYDMKQSFLSYLKTMDSLLKKENKGNER